MARSLRLLGPLLASLAAVGCAPTPVDVEMSYPSRDTFLFSDFGRLLVYEVDLDVSAQNCPALIDDVIAGDFGAPVYDSDWNTVCDFRDGGLGLDSIPPGPHAYVGLTRDESNNLLLAGCRIGEAYEGAPPVQIRLFPTPTYHDATQGRALACSNEDEKCRTGC